jgi:hypothetical protein
MNDSLSPYIADYDSPADTQPIRLADPSRSRSGNRDAKPLTSAPESMPVRHLIRSFDATIEDVNPQRRSVVARINTASRDRFNTVILPRGCRHKNWRAAGGPVLWEHGKDVRRGSDPVANGKELWNNGGPSPTEIVAEPVFLADEFSQQRYEWVRDGIVRSWSINALPTPGTYGPPSREELRAHPDWEDVDCVFRDWDMIEFSLTVRPGNADALTTDHASKVMKMVERGLIWMPDEVEPMYREAIGRTTVSMPGLAAESRDVPIVPGGVPIISDAEALAASGAPYGYCPTCGAKGVERERRSDGNDKCENGHVYPAKSAVQSRTMTDSVSGLAGGGAALKPDDGEDEEEDGPDEHGKPRKKRKPEGDGESLTKSNVGPPQPVAKSADDTAAISRRIVEEDGKFFVLSEDGSKRLGGPYGSRGEAEKRLEQVEYFKHEDGERAAPETSHPVLRSAPYIDTDESTWTVRRPDGSAIAIYPNATDAEECLRMLDQGASRPFELVLAEMLIEQRSIIDARQDDLIARIELEYFGRLGSDTTTRS